VAVVVVDTTETSHLLEHLTESLVVLVAVAGVAVAQVQAVLRHLLGKDMLVEMVQLAQVTAKPQAVAVVRVQLAAMAFLTAACAVTAA
jgi:hypothetical protein